MKVLIFDTDPATAAGVSESFEGNVQFDVVLAAGVEDMAFSLQHESFDVALIAINGTPEQAFKTSDHLRQDYPTLCLGFLMENPPTEVRKAAHGYSALGMINKPITPEKLAFSLQQLHGPPSSQVSDPKAMNAVKDAIETGGALSNFKLVDLIQMCCISQKTGRLLVEGDGKQGSIYIVAGSVVHAEIPGLEGEDAVYEMVGWDSANSTLDETVGSPKVTISAGWEHLMMEGVRRKDERGEEGGGGRDLRLEAGAEDLIGKIVGPFRVRRKLATDYWGTLYEALQVAVNRPVALKVLSPGFYEDEEQVHQFIAFAGAMAKAQNPYITAVYEAGEGNGLIFYAREHVDGANLKDRLKQGQVFPEDLALRVIINVGEALHYEKKNAILHMPLTLEQVLIPDTGVPKLLNNVTMEGGEVSAGEIDEIHRLGTIIKQGMEGATIASPEFKALLEKMAQAGQGGFSNWDTLLHETHQLDLNRRAMRVVRPMSSIEPEPEEAPSKFRPWMKWVALGVAALAIGGSLAWHYILRFQSQGAKDVDATVEVAAGPFMYQGGEKATLPSFRIDKYEVTLGQYRKFLEAWTKNKSAIRAHPQQRPGKDYTPLEWDLVQAAIASGSKYRGARIFDNTPVFNVDYFDAWAYAAWAGKRLPSEQEWEKAARGPNGNLFPWGNTFDPKKANTGADQRLGSSDSNFGKIDGFGMWSPVGAKRGDRTFYGVMDMAGNVSEWTDSWDTHPDYSTEKVPVVRGGSWSSTEARLIARELRQSKLKRAPFIGFRCVQDDSNAKK